MRPTWHHKRLGDVVAFAVHTDSDSRSTFAATSLGGPAVIVPAELLGEFLHIHADADLVGHDVGRLHWSLHRELHSLSNTDGLRALWRLSRKSRLHDVMFMDQRYRLVTTGVFPLPRQLEELTSVYIDATESENDLRGRFTVNDDRRSFSRHAPNLAATRVAATLSVYQPLRQKIDEFSLKKLAAKYGPLGLGIDVQGAIALERAQCCGLFVNPEAVPDAQRFASELFRQSSELIRSDSRASCCFKWDGGLVILDGKGYPRIKKNPLREWLADRLERFQDIHSQDIVSPLDDSERLSLVPGHWGMVAICDPLLSAWRDLLAAATMQRWLESGGHEVAHPTYQLIPEICSLNPDLERFLKLNTPLFQPRTGQVFLIGDLLHLEVRCFALLLQIHHNMGQPVIGRVFSGGGDLIERVAAILYNQYQSILTDEHLEGNIEAWGEQLRDAGSNFSTFFNGIARRVLWALPRGLTASQIREVLRRDDPRFSNIPERAGNMVIGEVLRILSEFKPGTQCETEPEQSKDGLDQQGVSVTLTGRIGRPAFLGQEIAAAAVEMADEVRKHIAFELVAAGHRLVAVTGDEFVLEVPEDHCDLASSIRDIAVVAAGKIIRHTAKDCCVCRVAYTW